MRWAPLMLCLSGCISLPWGSGGTTIVAPEHEIAGGIVRQLGVEALTGAAEKLSRALNDRWGPFELPAATGPIVWGGLALELGQLDLNVTPTGLEAELVVSAPTHAITLGVGAEVCEASLTLEPATLTVGLELAPDKLGRVQGSVRSTRLEGDVVLDASCAIDVPALVNQALATAIGETLGPALATELAPALSSDLALQWSSPFAADAIGTGFVRASVRGRAEDLAAFEPPRLQITFAVGIEAEAHPCIAPLALPAPDVDGPVLPPQRDGNDGALIVRLSVLEQALRAAWVAGAVCADHAAQGDDVVAGELAPAWPALARYPEDTRLRIELWPEALPALTSTEEGNVRVSTGPVAIDVWVEDGGWWRAASATIEVTLDGTLTASPEGLVWFDPLDLDITPVSSSAGLLQAPDNGALATILAPLVEQVVVAQPLVRLPSSARPTQYEVFEIGLDHAVLLP